MQKTVFSVRTLVYSAMFMAIAVVLARLLAYAPTESTRYSLETLPIFLTGLFFGPLAGALVGFGSDLIGCLLSPYGYNPVLCLPPILLGLIAGLLGGWVEKKPISLRLALTLALPILFGYILEQSAALTFTYHREAFLTFFPVTLTGRSIQYGIIYAVVLVLTGLLYKPLHTWLRKGETK